MFAIECVQNGGLMQHDKNQNSEFITYIFLFVQLLQVVRHGKNSLTDYCNTVTLFLRNILQLQYGMTTGITLLVLLV